MELIVSKQKDNFYTFLSALIVIIAVAILILIYKFAGNIVFTIVPVILFAGGLFARIVYINNNKVEFEYSFNTGILNIDKIINQTRRHHVMKITVSDILTFGMYNPNDNEIYKKSKEVEKFLDCSSEREDVDSYYFTCNYENKGVYMVVFEPNDKFLSVLKGSSSAVNKGLMTQKKY